MKFNHIGISVSDIERSVAFYREMFGMELIGEVYPFGGEKIEAIMDIPGVTGRVCNIGKNGLKLELFEFTHSKPKDPDYPVSDRGYSHFGFEVEDIVATYEQLRAAKVRIHAPIMTFTGGMKSIYCRDPDGNVFEVMEPPRPAQSVPLSTAG